MTKSEEAVMSVITAHAAVTHATERHFVVADMQQRVVYTTSARTCFVKDIVGRFFSAEEI